MRPQSARRSAAIALLCLPLPAAQAGAASRPDLAVTRLVEPPSALQPGDEFSTLAVVANRGRTRAPATHTAFHLSRTGELDASAVRVATTRTHRLRARSRTDVVARIRVPDDMPTGGQWQLVACVDARERVRESDERRNCFASAGFLFIRGG